MPFICLKKDVEPVTQKSVFAITLAHLTMISAFSFHPPWTTEGILRSALGAVILSGPLILASGFSASMKRAASRMVLLVFAGAFCVLTLVVFLHTFAGERDALYQLEVLLIPIIGYPAVMAAGILAFLSGWIRARP